MRDETFHAGEIVRRARFSELSAPQACLAWSPDGKSLLSGGEDGIIHALDADSGHCRYEFETDMRRSPVTSLAWSDSPTRRDFAATTAWDLLIFSRQVTGSPFRRERQHLIADAAVMPAPDTSQHPGEQFLVLHEGRLKGYSRQASPPGAYDIKSLPHAERLLALAWSPGATLAAVLVDGIGIRVLRVPGFVEFPGRVGGMTTLVGARIEAAWPSAALVHDWTGDAPRFAWMDGGRSLLVLDRAPRLGLARYRSDLAPGEWIAACRRELMAEAAALAGDPLRPRYAVATDGRLYVLDDAEAGQRIVFEAALAPGSRPAIAFSPDGRRLAVTRRVLGESEEPRDDDLHRVTILELGPREPEPAGRAREPDPRYAEGAPPAD